jgi:hypothetical protein
MTEPNDAVLRQLHLEIMKASERVDETAAMLKDLQGEMVVLKAELVLRGDRIRELLEHNELLAEENRLLRRQLADARYEMRRMHNGDL